MDREQVTGFLAALEEAAYRRGRREAVEQIISLLTSMLDEPHPQQAALPLEEAAPQSGFKPRLRQNSDQFRVFMVVTRQPGVRGVEIVQALEQAGHPIKERTMRTALHRLRTLSLIKLEGAGWHPTGMKPIVLGEANEKADQVVHPDPPPAGGVAERLNASD